MLECKYANAQLFRSLCDKLIQLIIVCIISSICITIYCDISPCQLSCCRVVNKGTCLTNNEIMTVVK